MKPRVVVGVLGFWVIAIGGSAYADTVNNPGSFEYKAGTDAKVQASGSPIFFNPNPTVLPFRIDGVVDATGAASFGQADFGFIPYTDSDGYTATVQATSDGTGSLCPNSGDATITAVFRIRITAAAGTPITTCTMTLNGGNPLTLTTKTSGSLTGAPLTSVQPKFVSQITLGSASGGCTLIQKALIDAHYGANSTADFILPDASIDQLFTGNGC